MQRSWHYGATRLVIWPAKAGEKCVNLKFVFSRLGLLGSPPAGAPLAPPEAMLLSEIPIGQVVQVARIAGSGSFRRRLMELGLVPGTRVELLRVAPLGDPLELLVRGASLSIRKQEASAIEVQKLGLAQATQPAAAALEPDLGI